MSCQMRYLLVLIEFVFEDCKAFHMLFTSVQSSSSSADKLCWKLQAGMIPIQMELGGKDACIVCHDADLELAAKNIVKVGAPLFHSAFALHCNFASPCPLHYL